MNNLEFIPRPPPRQQCGETRSKETGPTGRCGTATDTLASRRVRKREKTRVDWDCGAVIVRAVKALRRQPQSVAPIAPHTQ